MLHLKTISGAGAGRSAAAAWRRLMRCRAGSAAAEFGILLVPFLGLAFLILNTALVFFAQQTLQTATTQAARLIMTGQAQGMSAAQFKQAVCADATALFDCGGIYVNVQTYSSFSAIAPPNPIKNGNLDTSGMGFSPGVSGDIEVVQVFYKWPLFATLLGYNFANLSGNNDLLVGTAAFRNEPFSQGLGS
ncbi:MAG TPA: TadE/TadG family type IV pilus assembly protein [Stellaceae bacterium]|nr:TadE/TadG family type IV pilus assembly protein [Stellaceae bacterium]